MNREIKFRGRRLDNGEWVTGCYAEFVNYLDCDTKPGIQVINEVPSSIDRMIPAFETELVEVDPATVGQYTGLKDKNGAEIYKGDIVQRQSAIYALGKNEPIGEYTAIGVVAVIEDGNNAPYWVVKAKDHRGNDANMLLFVQSAGWHHPWYKIGTIHDNPELLGGVKDA